MKILHITTQQPHSTGSGTYMSELINSYDRLGYQQGVIAGIYHDTPVHFPSKVDFFPVFYTNDGDVCQENDIPYKILGMSDTMPYPATCYKDMTESMFDSMRSSFLTAAAKAIDTVKPDLVICHHLYLLTALIRESFPDIKMCGICHGSDIRQLETNPFHREEIKSSIRMLDSICALHAEQKKHISALYNIPMEKINVIGSGYNSSVFNDKAKQSSEISNLTSIIYAGKLCKEKGLLPFFNALTTVAEEGVESKVVLKLAGGCTCSEIGSLLQIENGVKKKGMLSDNSKIEFDYLGILSQEELAAAFNESDIFVLPSYYEGLPLVLIESMACGLLPICSNLPGVKEWIDGVIPDNNAVFVDMPNMIDVGEPDPRDIKNYESSLKNALMNAIHSIEDAKASQHYPLSLPNTKQATWDSVAKEIIKKF